MSVQYASPHRLKDRIALHERFAPDQEPFHSWLLRQVQAPANARVLEVGCGSGHMWTVNKERVPRGWQLTLTDASEGMVAEAERNLAAAGLTASVSRQDVTALPYGDATFDVAFANHMLYLAPSVERAVNELRRVIARGGRLYAATNGPDHMKQVREEVARLHEAVPQLEIQDVDLTAFDLVTGETALRSVFDDVRVFERSDTLVVTEPEPYVRYVLSLVNTPLDELMTNDPASADRFLAWRQTVLDRFSSGPVTVKRVSGFFEAF